MTNRRIARTITAGLLSLTIALGSAACASTSAATAGPGPDDVTIAELWRSLQSDVMDGRSHSAEARARELLALQELRCRQLRGDLLEDGGGTASAVDTSALARCEDDLQEYRTLARLSDLPIGFRR